MLSNHHSAPSIPLTGVVYSDGAEGHSYPPCPGHGYPSGGTPGSAPPPVPCDKCGEDPSPPPAASQLLLSCDDVLLLLLWFIITPAVAECGGVK